MADGMVGTVAKAAAQGAIKGGASGGGLLSTPFKAIQAGGNLIKGIKRVQTLADSAPVKKSVFKPSKPKAAIKAPSAAKPNPQLVRANKAADKFASKVKPTPIVAPKANVGGTINKFQNQQKKIAKGLANPVAKPTYEDKLKKALGMKA